MKSITCPTCGNEYDSKSDALIFKRVALNSKPGKMSESELRHELKEMKADRDALLRVVQRTYEKHHLDVENIGWDELATEMADVLSNVMGPNQYSAWLEAHEGNDDGVPHLGWGGRE